MRAYAKQSMRWADVADDFEDLDSTELDTIWTYCKKEVGVSKTSSSESIQTRKRLSFEKQKTCRSSWSNLVLIILQVVRDSRARRFIHRSFVSFLQLLYGTRVRRMFVKKRNITPAMCTTTCVFLRSLLPDGFAVQLKRYSERPVLFKVGLSPCWLDTVSEPCRMMPCVVIDVSMRITSSLSFFR